MLRGVLADFSLEVGMIAPSVQLSSVPVNIRLVDDVIMVTPESAKAVQRPNKSVGFLFRSDVEFTVEFKGESPFSWSQKASVPEDGWQVVDGEFAANGLPDGVTVKGWKYSVTIGETTLDPEVVVRKDPMG
jgi:hypothetical protein